MILKLNTKRNKLTGSHRYRWFVSVPHPSFTIKHVIVKCELKNLSRS